MRISTKGRYAMRMLIDLAENQNGEYIALKDIAKRQNISKKYLEQIIPILNSSKILSANRGSQGGYKLAAPAKNYTVADILSMTEGSLAPVACAAESPTTCERCEDCAMYPVWKGLYDVTVNYLNSITLQDIADMHMKKMENDYSI